MYGSFETPTLVKIQNGLFKCSYLQPEPNYVANLGHGRSADPRGVRMVI